MNTKNKKIRNSNYELMRIISMFLIVLVHIIIHGHILQNCTNQSLKLIINFIVFFALIHVNSFILVCGYFQSKSTFKQSNLWSIINANWFYRIFIMIILLILGLISVDKVTFIKEILPININEYWFIKNYILLYCLSPFINKAISSFDKKTFQRLLILLFIIFSILPTITGNNFIHNTGYTLYSFICLYLVGAYLREYPVDKSYIFKKMSNNMYQIVLIIIFFSMLFANLANHYFVDSIIKYNTVINEFGSYFTNSSKSYSNPFIIIQSIAYFCFFGTLNIKNNKKINRIAALTFGVYLIHDNNFIRSILYDALLINKIAIKSYKIIIYIFIAAIIIFIICSIIEFLRQVLFKLIYNFKISYKIRNSYYNFINNIYFIK